MLSFEVCSRLRLQVISFDDSAKAPGGSEVAVGAPGQEVPVVFG